MADHLRLEILSPSGMIYEGDIQHVMAPGQDGYFGVLPNHTPMIAALTVGHITADLDDSTSRLFATSGGVAEVHGDRVVVLAETAEPVEKIDIARAEEAAERARQRLHSEDEHIDYQRAKAALARALNRIELGR